MLTTMGASYETINVIIVVVVALVYSYRLVNNNNDDETTNLSIYRLIRLREMDS